jgi:hypothetical protein
MFFAILPMATNGQAKSEYSNLKLNQIQMIGSHNSYKKAIEPGLWKLIFKKDSLLAYSLQYEHLPLDSQLNLGLRGLELDIYYDPTGGIYKNPLGLKFLQMMGIKSELYDKDNKLSQPGFKVFHIQDLDFRSDNLLFVDCLRTIKKWSDANKGHTPIIITMNAKDSKIDLAGTVVPLPFTKSALDGIDLEIHSVFSNSDLITPDYVRGKYSTLEDAILKKGWPMIDSVRGRVLFILDETDQKLNDYLNADKSLNGKVLFVNAEEGSPSAAFRIINDPIKNENYIKSLVNKGYLIRTRADEETIEARSNNYKKFEAAIRSGAQIISTDYYLPSHFFESSYRIVFEKENYIRTNYLYGNTAESKKNKQ